MDIVQIVDGDLTGEDGDGSESSDEDEWYWLLWTNWATFSYCDIFEEALGLGANKNKLFENHDKKKWKKSDHVFSSLKGKVTRRQWGSVLAKAMC